LSAGKSKCCFLDASILISNFFGKFKNKLEKFLTTKVKYGIPCYVSSSVEDECNERIVRVLDFMGESMSLLRMRLAGEKTKTQHEIILTEQDILLIELLMRGLYRELSEKAKSEGEEVPEIEQTLLRTLEDSLVDFFEERFKEAFKVQKKTMAHKKDITPDSMLVEEIHRVGVPKKDAAHVASALQYISSNTLLGVFVSLDYKHIVNFQEQIYEKFKFQVCDPVYAYWHLNYEETFRELIESRSS